VIYTFNTITLPPLCLIMSNVRNLAEENPGWYGPLLPPTSLMIKSTGNTTETKSKEQRWPSNGIGKPALASAASGIQVVGCSPMR
jgi:hypothetical protein